MEQIRADIQDFKVKKSLDKVSFFLDACVTISRFYGHE